MKRQQMIIPSTFWSWNMANLSTQPAGELSTNSTSITRMQKGATTTAAVRFRLTDIGCKATIFLIGIEVALGCLYPAHIICFSDFETSMRAI
jgi:hypothetical protein